MNSPPEPSSPSPSSPSSSSPPPEEMHYVPQSSSSAAHVASQLASQLSSFIGAGASKRRLPGGSSSGAANTRDPKSRRREDSRRQGGGGGSGSGAGAGASSGVGGSGSGWVEGKDSGKREKDDLVDLSLVEVLRKGAVALLICDYPLIFFFCLQRLVTLSRRRSFGMRIRVFGNWMAPPRESSTDSTPVYSHRTLLFYTNLSSKHCIRNDCSLEHRYRL
jgi:hypothetical protein